MKKYLIVVLAILLLLLLCCKSDAKYPFLQSAENIASIEIVRISDDEDGKKEVNQMTIYSIQDKEKFLQEFLSLECNRRGLDPTCPRENIPIIKILYADGEYELIDYCGQATYTNERQYQHYKGYYSFESEGFDALLYSQLLDIFLRN